MGGGAARAAERLSRSAAPQLTAPLQLLLLLPQSLSPVTGFFRMWRRRRCCHLPWPPSGPRRFFSRIPARLLLLTVILGAGFIALTGLRQARAPRRCSTLKRSPSGGLRLRQWLRLRLRPGARARRLQSLLELAAPLPRLPLPQLLGALRSEADNRPNNDAISKPSTFQVSLAVGLNPLPVPQCPARTHAGRVRPARARKRHSENRVANTPLATCPHHGNPLHEPLLVARVVQAAVNLKVERSELVYP